MKKRLIWITIGVVIIAAIAFFVVKSKKSATPVFQFAMVTRGDLLSTISSAGTLNAVGTVNVGTQVSGTISSLFVDFNDKVQKGQALAVLDTTLLASAVHDAEANQLRADAQYRQAVADYQRNAPLFEKGYLSGQEILPLQTAVEVTKAGLASAQSALARAHTNLSYSIIVSPIDGTVIERNIDAGQTVAASFSTPTLFVIANDLSLMQIFASVDESDIGAIRLGQKVSFTVQTYPDESFSGVVQQIRLKPINVQNVVTYTVVIDAPNEKGLMLPGMTATVDFVIKEVKDVLRVPNNALRYEPTPIEMAQLGSQQVKDFASGKAIPKKGKKDSTATKYDSIAGGKGNGSRKLSKDMARIWMLDPQGKLIFKVIQTGLTDSKLTEVVSGEGATEGVEVITGILDDAAKTKAKGFNMMMRGPH
jgi:HlyD family secretion protein